VSLEKQKPAYENNFSGSNAVTYLQFTYKSRYFAKFFFGQTTVAYKSQVRNEGGSSVIDAKANTNNIGVNLGYRRPMGRWTPYVMAGSGIALVDVPSVSYDANAGQSVYSTKSKPYNVVTAGAGVDYKIGKYFVPFLEGQLSAMPNPSAASLTHLSGVSLLIGIKASLF
jgi:opacity protein-like surface antigen